MCHQSYIVTGDKLAQAMLCSHFVLPWSNFVVFLLLFQNVFIYCLLHRPIYIYIQTHFPRHFLRKHHAGIHENVDISLIQKAHGSDPSRIERFWFHRLGKTSLNSFKARHDESFFLVLYHL